MDKRQTNADYAIANSVFRKACLIADTEITIRQASKFRMKRGLAFEFKSWAKAEVHRRR